MSEDSSSDEERSVFTKLQTHLAHPKSKCWECGKAISGLTNLLLHYKRHNIEATCHICEITFRRLTSLSTHLDNAHLPPFCLNCQLSFSNTWELNKHAETCRRNPVPHQNGSFLIDKNDGGFSNQQLNLNLCNSASNLIQVPKVDMTHETLEMSENTVEYIVGEDNEYTSLESNCGRNDLSSSISESDNDGSSTSTCVSDSEETPAPHSSVVRCADCGGGPYRSLRLHLLHCVGVKKKYMCVLCKNIFPTEASLQEHHMPLYLCHSCGQVFPDRGKPHYQCPQVGTLSLVLFCSESMPKPCNICKSFFVSEKALTIHVTKTHSSVVSTKICIITNPSLCPDLKRISDVHGTEMQSDASSPGAPKQVLNGLVYQTHALSGPNFLKSYPSSFVNQSSEHLPASCAPGSSSSSSYSVNSEHDYSLTATVLGLFENQSRQLALLKRMNSGWRSKPPCKCRQCGAIFRQPSLIISHRYLHRGRRLHRCHCGRTFKHQLHLLRHCVQHAEASSYICVNCGDTFTGAKLLDHLAGKLLRKSHYGRTLKTRGKNKCIRPFTCNCGRMFLRPSTFIWHQIKSKTQRKRTKNPLLFTAT